MNRADHVFAVVDVDVAEDRKAEQAHRFLPVHQHHDARFTLALDQGDQSLPRGFKQLLFDDRLKSREHEKQPENIHFHSPIFSTRTRLPRPFERVFIWLRWTTSSRKKPAEKHPADKSADVRPPRNAPDLLRAGQRSSATKQLAEKPD